MTDYRNNEGQPVTLGWLIRNEPDWARNQILHRDKLLEELAALHTGVLRAVFRDLAEQNLSEDPIASVKRLRARLDAAEEIAWTEKGADISLTHKYEATARAENAERELFEARECLRQAIDSHPLRMVTPAERTRWRKAAGIEDNAPHQARRDSGVAMNAVVGGSGTEEKP